MRELPSNPATRLLATYPMERLHDLKNSLRARGITIYDFGTGDPIEPTPAFLREIFIKSVPTVSQYPTIGGMPTLRASIGKYIKKRFGVDLDPEREIIPSSGSKEAIYHLASAFIDPRGARRGVAYLEPCYAVYRLGALFAGAEPIALGLRDDDKFYFRPDLPGRVPKDAGDKIAILWINYPHNPTGAQMDLAGLRRAADWARERGILLACDECYCDVHGGNPAPSMLQAAREGILVFHSLSKRSGMTGYRQGFVAGDPKLIATYRAVRAGIGVAPHEPGQHAAIAAWSDEAHAEERRKVFAAKRDLFLTFFAGAGIRVVASESAILYLWIAVPAGMNSQQYALKLAETGIVISPGTDFGAAGEGFARLALVPDLDGCRKAIETWRKCL
ncbi:MAG: aminotransferase class I/II-fold pyridoxal phosphate-dependent enzyme [Planctomycetes bacterium]|nr:aminotransferase class I/II-fold pyridoxal phosphate-dependent enzyme [Planctomycetota bacterium]